MHSTRTCCCIYGHASVTGAAASSSDNVYPLLAAYTAPDIEAMLVELLAAGIPEKKARSVLAETYDENSVSEYARTCGAGIVQIFEELVSGMDQKRLAENFHRPVVIQGAL